MSKPQRPLRLLSLDGGGVRGLSSLYILRGIMSNVNHEAGRERTTPIRPCDCFDLIAGTSTGGLIAVMLGILQMDVQTCINEYLEMSPEIFPPEGFISRSKVGQLLTVARGKQRFGPEPLEIAIKRLVKKYLGNTSEQGEETLLRFKHSELGDDQICRVFVCVTSEKQGEHFRFRNYESPWDIIDDCPIWQACRATSAAPTIFPPMIIGNPSVAYVDGGLGYNNPIRALRQEKSRIWPNRQIGCMVSIGTGVLPSMDVGRTPKTLFEKVRQMATDTETVASEFENEITREYGNEQKVYFRFNVPQGLEQVKLEEWDESDRIQVATRAYLGRNSSWIEACSSRISRLHAPETSTNHKDIGLQGYNMTPDEAKCLQSLWPKGIDHESQKDQNPKCISDTCLWALHNAKYTAWRDNDSMNLLWISAGPGCGKSVLARCVIDEDLPSNTSRHVLFYFFKDTGTEQRSAASAIASILHQLFTCRPDLIRHAMPTYLAIGEALPTSFPRLWSIFVAAATDPSAGDIACCFDALDECNKQEQKILIERLKRISLPSSRVKILIISRPYFDIKRALGKSLDSKNTIELAGDEESENIKSEISLVIKDRVAELREGNLLSSKTADHLKKRLLRNEDRTYLWLRLVWELIEGSLSDGVAAMNELIDDLPSGITESYDTLLQRCPDRRFARRVLEVVLVARRPLTLDEISFPLGWRKDVSSYSNFEMETADRLIQTLPSRCGLMVSIIQSKIYFIHHTVKDYLLEKDDLNPLANGNWQRSFDLKQSHSLMLMICFKCIAFSNIRWDRANVYGSLLPEDDRNMEPNPYCQVFIKQQKLPLFLSYSVIHWADHYRDEQKSEKKDVTETVLQMCGDPDRLLIKGRAAREYGPLLCTVSGGGHDEIVQILLANGTDASLRFKGSDTALLAASRNGHNHIVEMLLERGADIDGFSDDLTTPLVGASRGGHDQTVMLLLSRGAHVNLHCDTGGTALLEASRYGHDRIVQTLLEKGSDVNTYGGRALREASERGHAKVVQMLLEKFVDVNSDDANGITALEEAARRGHKKITQMLVEKGIGVDYTARALSAALSNDHVEIVEILLEKINNINTDDAEVGTVLETPAEETHKKIRQMLIAKGVEIGHAAEPSSSSSSLPSSWGQMFRSVPLKFASLHGQIEKTRWLLAMGADVNLRPHFLYGFALQAATFGGNEQTVEMLLNAGADVNKSAGFLDSPLTMALEFGHVGIAKMLQEKGALPNRRVKSSNPGTE